jgi:hypothetical protein
MNALRLEKKRIRKEDGRYLLFYHSAESASAEQQAAFTEVVAEVEPVTGKPAGAGTKAVHPRAAGQESADV